MRVISGKYKRRLLKAPQGSQLTRPTSDRVKESLFNILGPTLEGANVLDLFAGSGALGIEALSRGAKFVTFVEKDPDALAALKFNLTSLGVEKGDFCIVKLEVEKFLKNPAPFLANSFNREEIAVSTNLVFADPPYASTWYDQAVDMLEASSICARDCLAVFEMALHFNMPESHSQFWSRVDERNYGNTRLEFWSRQEEHNGS